MNFITRKQVRFHHCDPAGIVFYPQFFYLLHEAQEDFLAHIGHPEHGLIASGLGVPIVDLKTSFLGMCRYGDEIDIHLGLTKLGRTSIGMTYEVHLCGAGVPENKRVRLRASSVVVCSRVPDGQPVPLPDDLRTALSPYLQDTFENALP
ncbi:MAG: thioesterase family protein [Pseudomonadota bacterium]